LNTRNHHSSSPAPRRSKDREIARLKSELAAERSRSARLERELSALRRELKAQNMLHHDKPFRRLAQKARGTHRREHLLDQAGRRACRYRKSSFFRYLWEAVKESAPVQIIQKLVEYLRRVRLVQTIFTILAAVGAVVAVAVVSAAVLPFLFFGTALLTMLATLRSRRMNRILRRELTDRRIRIMIPPRGGSLDAGSFFIRNARAMAAEEGVTVIVVTPYTVSGRGLGGRGRFFTARREAENLYVVRRHYFFTLRRRVLDRLDGEITVVY
jgi:predicted RNase H-like nuclease (RuvC/YqgF family)